MSASVAYMLGQYGMTHIPKKSDDNAPSGIFTVGIPVKTKGNFYSENTQKKGINLVQQQLQHSAANRSNLPNVELNSGAERPDVGCIKTVL